MAAAVAMVCHFFSSDLLVALKFPLLVEAGVLLCIAFRCLEPKL